MKKMIGFIRILIILLYCTAAFIPGCAASINGYIVEPVTPGMDTGTPLETVEVDFWDLPPGVILLALMLSLSSFVGFPVEFLVLLKLFTVLGFRKISRSTVFHNTVRNHVYECICQNPGIFFNELARISGINRGSLRYHLKILILMRRVAVIDSYGNPHYFDNCAAYTDEQKAVLSHIGNEIDCRILRHLVKNPDLSRNDLAEYVGLSVSTVSWRMNRLCCENIILIGKAGKYTRYQINPQIQEFLRDHIRPDMEKVPLVVDEMASEPA